MGQGQNPPPSVQVAGQATAGQTNPTPTAQLNGDTTLKRRISMLYQETYKVVSSGAGKVRRAKRGVISYRHGKTQGLHAREFWTFTVIGGGVMAVVGALGFAVLAWWALIPGVAVGVLYAIGSSAAQKKWTKKTAKDWLKEMDNKPLNSDISVDLTTDATKAEAILTLLIREHIRFESKLDKYFGKSLSIEKRLNTKSVFEKVMNPSSRIKVGNNLKKASPLEFKNKRIVRKELDLDTAIDKLAAISMREKYLIRYSRKYLMELKQKVEDFYVKDLPDLEKAVETFVEKQVGVHKWHDILCKDDNCWGPKREDVSTSPLSVNDLQKATQQAKAGGAFIDHFERNSAGAGGIKHTAALGDEGLIDKLDEIGMAIEHISGTGIGAGAEGLEGLFSKKVADAAGGAGADLGLAPVGWALGIGVSELIKKFTVTMPTQHRTGEIRKAIVGFSEGNDAQFKVILHKDVADAVKKGKPEMLTKALNMVHAHYIKRLTERHEKLVKAYGKLKGTEPTKDMWIYNCDDAVMFIRYYMKVLHYAEKAYAHIMFILGAVDVCENRMTKIATDSGSNFDV